MHLALAPMPLVSRDGANVPSFRLERRRRARPRYRRKLQYWDVQADGNRSPYYETCKRSLDILGSSLLSILLSPVLLATYLLLYVITRGKPIFRQTRVGECGKLFTIYKFRTMVIDAESLKQKVLNEQSGPVFKNRRDPRMTRVGAWLRKFSIDELPQLFNILRGEMSLVGPRPALESEVTQYQNWQLRRLSVKPGLTCIWQVSGRSEIGFEQWVRMDLRYINSQNLPLDLLLLAKTPLSILSCRGAY